jgi:hypothetical protein
MMRIEQMREARRTDVKEQTYLVVSTSFRDSESVGVTVEPVKALNDSDAADRAASLLLEDGTEKEEVVVECVITLEGADDATVHYFEKHYPCEDCGT